MIAVSCGTPTPATTRVVQIEPGPIPTLIEFGAGLDQSFRPFRGGDIAGHDLHRIRHALDPRHRLEHAPGMAVGGVDDQKIDASVDQALASHVTGFAHRSRSGHAQSPLLVFAGMRMRHGLFDVLHRDQADATIRAVNDQKLLDTVLMQEPLGLVLLDPFAHCDQPLLGHQLGDLLPLVGGEPHVAVGQNADQLAGPSIAGALHHRNPGDVMLLHQCQGIGEGCFRIDRYRVHDHARFEFLHLPHLHSLRFRIEIAVEHADAARLRHGDRHMRFRHRIHRRGDDRNVEQNVGCDARSNIDIRRHDVGQPRLQQHVIEGVCFAR